MNSDSLEDNHNRRINRIHFIDPSQHKLQQEPQQGPERMGCKNQAAQHDLNLKRLSQFCGFRHKMSRLKQVPRLAILLVLYFCFHTINCQWTSNADSTPTNIVNPNNQFEGTAEGRASEPQYNTLNQLVNLLNNYASNRRIPLPSIDPQRTQAAQTSTQPSNPYNAAQQFQSPIRLYPHPNHIQKLPVSTPTAPYLQLNRIYGSQPASNVQNQNNRPFNAQPISTSPLGAQQNNVNRIPPPRVAQPMHNQPFQSNTNQMQPMQQRSQNPVNLGQNRLKPLGGFAPSLPPPNLNPNNAMVVVQSPPNVIVQVNPPNTTNKAQGDDQPQTTLSPPASSTAEPTTISILSSSSTSDQDIGDKNSNSSADQVTTKETNWNPLEGDRTLEQPNKQKVSLAPSLDIVTVPPGYNPDKSNLPQNYDIAVSAQMGTPVQPRKPQVSQSPEPETVSPTTVIDRMSTEGDSSESTIENQASTSTSIPEIAPTAVTTIIWSPPPSETPTSIESKRQPQHSSTLATTQISSTTPRPTNTPPTRIRDNSLADEPVPEPTVGVVYGKPQAKDSKPTAPPGKVNPSPVSGQASFESSVAASGRPFIQSVQIDNQVRPFTSGTQAQQSVVKSNHGHAPFRPSRPVNGNFQTSPMQVGSGFTISGSGNQTMHPGDIQDYLNAQPSLLAPTSVSDEHEPTISARGGQDPANFDLSNQDSIIGGPNKQEIPSNNTSSVDVASSSTTGPRIRRPTFKPKPLVPPIRIDSCIVGDDSSCDQSHNERCFTEYGISSCHCKPGYARLSQLRGYCSPVSSLHLSMKIDKLSDDRKLVFNHTLDNSNSEEFQYLEFETIQALAGAFQQTSLAKQFMGARVNKFFERKGKVWANVSVNFEANNLTKVPDKIQTLASQELLKVVQLKQKPLGDSTIMLDGSKESISKLVDVNECASRELNDCSKYASCSNEFGSFQCHCLSGYEDKYQNDDKSKHGRVCLGCSPNFCSNRGECSIADGQKHCKCRPNFLGAQCEYDSEVLAVAVGGSLVGIFILVITFWCLIVFNRRWKREQQKMDAISATSGLTYNYVNSSTNSLMSPRILGGGGGVHRSAENPMGALTANYGHRFGARGGQHYAADQQAIIGSTSSGSSAASQTMACNPYVANYHHQYDDAGLLIVPASTGSSEQTSPSSNGGYRGVIGAANNNMYAQGAGNAYTLSGHHHHHHHPHPHMHHHGKNHSQLTQFHPGADYRTLNTDKFCPSTSNIYDGRWRTLQQDNKNLVGYYLVR